ncbi:RNase III domain-containing protein [Favolaschia claudopus]|uniref:RNase III domain-containing protein n=1 Tax=Favolaschia claudopus TaxID=2862362 RepID=A0AAW0D5R3_9AGAR
MSRSLSARCLHRTVFPTPPSLPPTPSRSLPGPRQYSYAALKKRPQAAYPRRSDNLPPTSRVVPHEPGIRLQQDQSWGHSHPPLDSSEQGSFHSEAETSRRPHETEREPRERRTRVGVASRGSDQHGGRGESSSRVAHQRHTSRPAVGQFQRAAPARSSPPPPRKPDQIFAEHLNGLFPPLNFPLELSARVLTHASHPAAFYGHNAQFSFIGRRVLETYLLLLLSSSPHLKPGHDLQEIVARVLNTYFLGEHIGSKWGLGRVMRWTPTVAASMLEEARIDKQKVLKDVGLYKVQGDAATAVVGAIFQQFGASVAHRVFHTRVLPRLLQPHGGLPTCFHPDAHDACTRLGGANGPLLLGSSVPQAAQIRASHDSPEQKQQSLTPHLNTNT